MWAPADGPLPTLADLPSGAGFSLYYSTLVVQAILALLPLVDSPLSLLAPRPSVSRLRRSLHTAALAAADYPHVCFAASVVNILYHHVFLFRSIAFDSVRQETTFNLLYWAHVSLTLAFWAYFLQAFFSKVQVDEALCRFDRTHRVHFPDPPSLLSYEFLFHVCNPFWLPNGCVRIADICYDSTGSIEPIATPIVGSFPAVSTSSSMLPHEKFSLSSHSLSNRTVSSGSGNSGSGTLGDGKRDRGLTASEESLFQDEQGNVITQDDDTGHAIRHQGNNATGVQVHGQQPIEDTTTGVGSGKSTLSSRVAGTFRAMHNQQLNLNMKWKAELYESLANMTTDNDTLNFKTEISSATSATFTEDTDLLSLDQYLAELSKHEASANGNVVNIKNRDTSGIVFPRRNIYVRPCPPQVSKDKLTLDIYTPTIKPQSPVPVIINVHNLHDWEKGDKTESNLMASYFSSKKYVVLCPNYRAPNVKKNISFIDSLIDLKRALYWTKENIQNYGGDPRKIILCGSEIGGLLASLLALQRIPIFQPGFEAVDIHSGIIGCIVINGVFDPLNMNKYIKYNIARKFTDICRVPMDEPIEESVAPIKDENGNDLQPTTQVTSMMGTNNSTIDKVTILPDETSDAVSNSATSVNQTSARKRKGDNNKNNKAASTLRENNQDVNSVIENASQIGEDDQTVRAEQIRQTPGVTESQQFLQSVANGVHEYRKGVSLYDFVDLHELSPTAILQELVEKIPASPERETMSVHSLSPSDEKNRNGKGGVKRSNSKSSSKSKDDPEKMSDYVREAKEEGRKLPPMGDLKNNRDIIRMPAFLIFHGYSNTRRQPRQFVDLFKQISTRVAYVEFPNGSDIESGIRSHYLMYGIGRFVEIVARHGI